MTAAIRDYLIPTGIAHASKKRAADYNTAAIESAR